MNPPPVRERRVGLVVPTRWEAAGIVKRWRFRRQGGSLAATVEDRPVLLRYCGVGKEKARAAAYALCDQGATELVSAGFCGALVSGLAVGTVLTDRVATIDRPARNRAERDAITGRANAVAVDMESQAVIEAGTRRGVPIRLLRVVSDRYEDDLTPLFGSDAGFSAVKIALRLLNPAVWPLAARLRRHSHIAQERLADAVAEYLRS